MTRLPLPPFGRAWLALRKGPRYLGQGARVAVGPGAWERARMAVAAPVMVTVPGRDPVEVSWPVAGESVLVYECGPPDDAALEHLVHVLLADGADLVHAIRDSDLPGVPPTWSGRAGPVWRRSA